MRRSRARHIALAAASGLLYPLCFPDFNFGALAWIVLVPLHLAVDGIAPRRAFWLGWLTGLLAFIGTMSWVVISMHLYGKLPLLPSYAVMLLLTGYLGLYIAVYAAGFAWMRRVLPVMALVWSPFLWVTLELIRTYLLSGLPWALLGYTQYQWLPIIQIADLTGVYGVSFLVVLVNAAVTDLILWVLQWLKRPSVPRAAGPVPWFSPAAALFGVAVALWYGYNQLKTEPSSSVSRLLRIGVVQANIDQAHKWDEAYRRETLDRYAFLTARAAPGADLLIWPEAATPFLFERESPYRAEIGTLVQGYGIPLLFGSPALRYYANGRPYLLNSAYLLSANGNVLGRYDKRHLVPFGEYVPLRSMLFFLDKLVEGIGDFEAGTVPTVLSLPRKMVRSENGPAESPVRLGVVICFEVIFPNLVRELVRNGAEFMVTITNDAWFGDSSAPYQHFAMVVLRAVENRIAFARAANTGISGFIDRNGRILATTPIFTEQAVTGEIAVRNAPTLYSHYGDVFAYGCVIITGLLLLAALIRPSGEEPRALVVGAPT